VRWPRFYPLSICAIAVVCWLGPCGSSLWLDEAGTFWLVKGTFAETWQRGLEWSGHPPLYYLIAWLAVRIGGANEFIMRLPSVAAMATATILVYRLGRRLLDEEAGWLAALVFSCIPSVYFAASDARPYAVALMFFAGHALALLRWLDCGKHRDAAAYILLAAATLHTHVLLAPGLIVPAVYAMWRTRRRLFLFCAWCAGVVLVLPILFLALRYNRERAAHTFAEMPTLGLMLEAFSPPRLIVLTGVGLLLAFLVLPSFRMRWPADRSRTVLLVAWMLFTPVLFFLLARFMSIQLFVPRYMISYTPALALLFGCLLRSAEPAAARRAMALVVVAGVIASFAFFRGFRHHDEDWRGVLACIGKTAREGNMPVFIATYFVEGRDPRALSDPRLHEALFAPELVYPPGVPVTHLPFGFNEAYFSQVFAEGRLARNEFLYLGSGHGLNWLRGRFHERHPAVETICGCKALEAVHVRLH
jgi:mannosyltransferase